MQTENMRAQCTVSAYSVIEYVLLLLLSLMPQSSASEAQYKFYLYNDLCLLNLDFY
jgi:hypothetical protein